ncbi:MAG: hydantoinase/carbamoylase family amidase, partial [Burkholderiaceae bacterium]
MTHTSSVPPESTPANATIDPAQQVMQWADALALHSDHPDHLTCTYMTAAHRAVALQLAAWMRACGFDDVHEDAVGNVVGRYRAASGVNQPALVATGSHYDTVRNSGRYDGRLGILLPMAVVAGMAARGERLPCDLEVVGFAEEQGVRYGSSFLGSSAYAGRFEDAMLSLRDAQGMPMRDALVQGGREVGAIAQARTDLDRLAQFFEVHIEQGPVLLEQNLPVGVVTAIAGIVRRKVVLTGLAGHAGTTPMTMRRDAAAAAAKIVLFVERRCAREPGLVGTVGQLEVPDGSVNVIPGMCRFSLDIRATDDVVRDAAVKDIEEAIHEICSRRNIDVQIEEILHAPAVPCAERHRAAWTQAIHASGHDALSLPSGAG